jgi:hypothetical protein
MRFVKFLLAVSTVLAFAGCAATGPLYSEVASSIPSVPADKGRIYFFRPDTMLGAAITAEINLNGKVVGKSERASFFYVDENPGKCTVSTTTEIERQLTFVLDPGQTKYVRTSVSFGVMVGRINPELVASDAAKAEITGLHYTGAPLAKK